MTIQLSPKQQKLFDVLNAKLDEDVPISEAYAKVFDDEAGALSLAKAKGGVRYMQQSLAPTIARINERHDGALKIEPGVTKQTYRLRKLG